MHTALAGRQADFPDHVHPNIRGAKTIAETVAGALTGHPVAMAAVAPAK